MEGIGSEFEAGPEVGGDGLQASFLAAVAVPCSSEDRWPGGAGVAVLGTGAGVTAWWVV